jgi:hypothetical protein
VDAGHLLSAGEGVEHYRWLCDETEEWVWHRSWLPIAHEGWYQCGVELDGEQRGLIVNASFPDAAVPLAPSVPAMLHATCATIEAGIPSRPAVFEGPEFESWLARRAAVVRVTYENYGGLPAEISGHPE